MEGKKEKPDRYVVVVSKKANPLGLVYPLAMWRGEIFMGKKEAVAMVDNDFQPQHLKIYRLVEVTRGRKK